MNNNEDSGKVEKIKNLRDLFKENLNLNEDENSNNDKLILLKKDENVSWKIDKYNLLMLNTLYTIQGIINNFFEGSLNTLLVVKGASYTQLGSLSFMGYPWSMKILWAPLLDTFYFKKFGKRKTYLVSICYTIPIALIILSFYLEDLVNAKSIAIITAIGFFFELLASLQDVAIDGLSVSMLHPENVTYAGYCQSLGQTIGGLFGNNLFIWFNSVQFCNKHIWSTPKNYPLLSIPTFLIIFAVYTFLIGIWIHLYKESRENIREFSSVFEVIKSLKGFWVNKKLRYFLVFYFFTSWYLAPINSGGSVILLRKGFNRTYFSTTSLICLPFSAIFSFFGSYIGRFKKEWTFFVILIFPRILGSISNLFIIEDYNKKTNDSFIYYINIPVSIYNSILDGIFFNLSTSFILRISDVEMGGTYLTFLNTFSNFKNMFSTTASLYLLKVVPFLPFAICGLIFGIIFVIIIAKFIINLEKAPKEEFSLLK